METAPFSPPSPRLFQKSAAKGAFLAVGVRRLSPGRQIRKWTILSVLVVGLTLPTATVFAEEPPTAKPAGAAKKRRPAYPGDDYIAIYVKLLKLNDAEKATLDATVEKYAQRLTDAQKAATTVEGKSAYKSLMQEFMDAVKADFTAEQRAKLTADREARKQRHMRKPPVAKPPPPPSPIPIT